jgi:capsid protein
VDATYDAARNGDEHKNYWANADSYDADSAHSPAVRQPLVERSRYEIANNGYASGIASTYANDLIGVGPSLRMNTGSEPFNRMVETEWKRWTKAVQFRRKLWCQAHAKHTDGESFAVLRKNKNVRSRIKLDIKLYETEQVQTPYLPYGEEGYIDGIKFDEFGNPVHYDILKHHPGSTNELHYHMTPEKVPARFVMHWFRMLRPGQHRGVPETVSTLNLGASARRWREAVVAAAENIADFSIMIKTMFEPDEMDSVSPMSTLDIQKRMMTALPAGYDAFQPKAEQPTANHAEFHKTLINEQARPKSMPFNKAACDSSNYNYASGRLDHSTYYGSLDVEREDCNDLVLDPCFDVWFEHAVIEFGWLGGNPDALTAAASAHEWDWPKHQVADIKSEASANATKLQTGETTLLDVHSAAGRDYEDCLTKEAETNGITVEQQRQINLLRNTPSHLTNVVATIIGVQVASQSPGLEFDQSQPEETDDDEE